MTPQEQADLFRQAAEQIVQPLSQRLEAFEGRVASLEQPAPEETRRAAVINAPSLITPDGEVTAREHADFIHSTPEYRAVQSARPQMVRTVGNFIRAIGLRRTENWSLEQTAGAVEKRFGDKATANTIRALNEQVGSDGGSLIPLEYAPEFITLLYANLVLTQLGARRVPLTNGRKRMRRVNAGATAKATPETGPIPVSQPLFGYVDLVAHDIDTFVALSNDLLYDTQMDANAIVVADVVMQMKLELERQILLGGGGVEIAGLFNNPNVQKLVGTAAGATKGAVTDLQGLDSAYWSANPKNIASGFLFHPRVKVWAKYVTSTTGGFIFRDELRAGEFNGYNYANTTQMPYNAGSGQTQMVLGDFSELVIGDALETRIDTSTEASFVDTNGATVSAFQSKLTLIRANQRVDAAVTHDAVFKILTVQNLNQWSWT